MTIASSYSPATYNGDGATTTFAITFAFLSTSTYVKVSIKVNATGVITEKTASTHYNISGSNVVFTAGNIPASGETVIIELDPDFLQSSDYQENDALPAETLEDDLDKATLELQLLSDLQTRSFRVDSAQSLSGVTLDIELPSSGTYVTTLSSTGIGKSLLADIASTSYLVTGSDLFLVSGTAGTSGDLALWNADGDLVDGPTPPTGTIVGTSDTQTLTNKTLTNPTINAATMSGTISGGTYTSMTLDADNSTISNIGSAEIKSEIITGQTSATIAVGDSILLSDVDDSDNLKKDTVQGILDLVTGDLEYISSATASSSASIEFTSGISSTYTTYVLIGRNVVPATDDVDLRLRVDSDGGLSYEATGYDGAQTQVKETGTSIGEAVTTYLPLGGNTTAGQGWGSDVGEEGSFIAYIFSPADASAKTSIVTTGGYENADGQHTASYGIGRFDTAQADNAFEITFDSGNIESGYFTLYGIRNA